MVIIVKVHCELVVPYPTTVIVLQSLYSQLIIIILASTKTSHRQAKLRH